MVMHIKQYRDLTLSLPPRVFRQLQRKYELKKIHVKTEMGNNLQHTQSSGQLHFHFILYMKM